MADFQKFMFDNFVIECEDDHCQPVALEPVGEPELSSPPAAENEPQTAEFEEIPATEPEPEPVKNYNEAELAEKVKQAEEAAYEKGFKSAQQGLEAKTVALLEAVNSQLTLLVAGAGEESKEKDKEVLALAKAVIRGIFPTMEEEYATASIQKFLEDNFPSFKKESSLAFYFNPEVIGDVKDCLARLANINDYEGKISLHKDAALGLSDCRVEWENGDLERDGHKMLEKVDKLLEE